MNLTTDKPQINIFEAILARRSVRSYAPNEVDRNTIQTLLEAAVRALTTMHEESSAFVVVQNKQVLKQISDLAKPSSTFVEVDCWLAAENLMLAACAIGLGSCVIGSAVAALNTIQIKDKLGIPAEFSAVVPIILGVPSGETNATPRNGPLVLAWVQ